MTTKIDLRKKPATTVQPFSTAPVAQAPAGLQGDMPIPTGKVVRKSLLPAEKRLLEELGIPEGTAVPGNLAEIVAAARAAALQENANAQPTLPLNTPPLRLPDAVPFRSLPAAHQQSILAAIQSASRTPAKPSTLDPSVQAAVQASVAVAEQGGLADLEIVDDRAAAVYADTGEPKRSQPATPPPAKPAKPAGEPPRVQPAPTTTADANPLLPYCPHCGWEVARQDPTIVSDDDKRSFLATLLGGLPWKKTFLLVGGSLSMTCRTLAGPEVDLCYDQAHREFKRGTIGSATDFAETVNRYRCMLQLVGVKSTAGMTHALPERVADWTVSPSDVDTPLVAIQEYFYANVLTNETLYRLAAATVTRFNLLVTKLEANTENADFWMGIVPQA